MLSLEGRTTIASLTSEKVKFLVLSRQVLVVAVNSSNDVHSTNLLKKREFSNRQHFFYLKFYDKQC